MTLDPRIGRADEPTMPKKLELSRRRLLGGLGTIGLASAGAGLGTSAYFNDTESFAGNTVTAGTLDMSVSATGFADQGGMGPIDGEFYNVDGGVGTAFSITDLKPGDTYHLCWCISNSGNPAVVRAYIPGESIVDQTGVEAGNLESGAAADLGVSEFETLLGSDHVTVTNNIYANCVSAGADHSGAQLLHGPINYDGNPGESTDGDSWPYGGGLGNWVTSLSNTPHTSQDGVPIGSHNGDGHKDDGTLDTGVADYILVGTNPGAHFETVTYCITIEVSPDAGNELQGAHTEFDLQFLAEQARHNVAPFADMATRPRDPANATNWTAVNKS